MKNINWDIVPLSLMSQQERRSYWENIHYEEYENVWSISEDQNLLDKILKTLKSLEKISRILVIGCGSKVSLQNTIAQEIQDVDEIRCIDFPKVIEIASQKNCHPKIKYESLDLTNLPWKNRWDIIINVNAILSESHKENTLILQKCWQSLDTEGVLLGFFPTVFCSLDIAYLEDNLLRLNNIDLKRSSFYEDKQDIWQIFYTPLRLRKLLIETKFSIMEFEVFFFDSLYAQKHATDYYDFDDSDLMIYEHFIIAKKLS